LPSNVLVKQDGFDLIAKNFSTALTTLSKLVLPNLISTTFIKNNKLHSDFFKLNLLFQNLLHKFQEVSEENRKI